MFISKKALENITDRIADLEKSREVQVNGRLTIRGICSCDAKHVFEYAYQGKNRQVLIDESYSKHLILHKASIDEKGGVLWIYALDSFKDRAMKCYCFSHGSTIATEIDAEAILKTKPEE